jgi:hypothetical protein
MHDVETSAFGTAPAPAFERAHIFPHIESIFEADSASILQPVRSSNTMLQSTTANGGEGRALSFDQARIQYLHVQCTCWWLSLMMRPFMNWLALQTCQIERWINWSHCHFGHVWWIATHAIYFVMVRMQIVWLLGVNECGEMGPMKICMCIVVSIALNFTIEGEPPPWLPVVSK